jgi:hypothetical protein
MLKFCKRRFCRGRAQKRVVLTARNHVLKNGAFIALFDRSRVLNFYASKEYSVILNFLNVVKRLLENVFFEYAEQSARPKPGVNFLTNKGRSTGLRHTTGHFWPGAQQYGPSLFDVFQFRLLVPLVPKSFPNPPNRLDWPRIHGEIGRPGGDVAARIRKDVLL